MAKVLMACVGGFLGAGKTTALVGAARELMGRGLRVGIITNDQGNNLVDTEVVRGLGFPAEEIAGGCFCCRFDEFVVHAERICEQHDPQVIFAEAVGSCTDLAATVYAPLRRFYAGRFDLAPLSIAVEPDRLKRFFQQAESGFPDSVGYLFEKQLAEADLILLNKGELIDPLESDGILQSIEERVGRIPVHLMSAREGWGIVEWVDRLLAGHASGQRILEIDYETYGKAEACLAWLNATVDAAYPAPFHPRDVGECLIANIQQRCSNAQAAIAHLKILIATANGSARIAVTEDRSAPQWSGEVEFALVEEASVVINARVSSSAELLREIVEAALTRTGNDTGVRFTVQDLQAFLPSAPKPRYRMQAQD